MCEGKGEILIDLNNNTEAKLLVKILQKMKKIHQKRAKGKTHIRICVCANNARVCVCV